MQKQETCAQELRYVKQRAAYKKKGEWEKWIEDGWRTEGFLKIDLVVRIETKKKGSFIIFDGLREEYKCQYNFTLYLCTFILY